jgi:hypothetical protein
VASVVARYIEPTASRADPGQSIEIIRFILGRIREEAPRGVKVVLAHQGTSDFLDRSSAFLDDILQICGRLHRPDDALAADPVHLLPDGH